MSGRSRLICAAVGLTLAVLLEVACVEPNPDFIPIDPLTVEPEMVCPGEGVTVCWDAGPQVEDCGTTLCSGIFDSECETIPCKRVTLTSDPPVLIDPPVDMSSSTTGCRTVFPEETTTFNVHIQFEEESQDDSLTVSVVDDLVLGKVFEGVCGGGSAGHTDVTLDDVTACMEVTELCNRSARPIILSGTMLTPGECTDTFNGLGKGTTFSAHHADGLDELSTICSPTEGGTEPDDISVAFEFRCNLERAACVTGNPDTGTSVEEDFVCGDGVCSEQELVEGVCPADCASGIVSAVCGDGTCNAEFENAAGCPADCPAVCGDGLITHGEACDGAGCAEGFTCSASCACVAASLPGSDGSLCGDGICQSGESPDWCGDCGSGGDGADGGDGGPLPAVCGNGTLEVGEQCENNAHCGQGEFCANCSCFLFQ